MTDVFLFCPVLAFFDSSTSYCFISDSFLALYSSLICMDAPRG